MPDERVKGFVFEIEVDPKTGEAKLRHFEGAVRQTMGESKKSASTLTSTFTDLKGVIVGVAAAIGLFTAFRQASAFMREATAAAAEQEVADRRLAAALVARGIVSQESLEQLQREATALQATIGIADDAAQRYQALAIRMGATVDEASRFVEVSQDIATVTDRDASRVLRTLGQVAAGTATDLRSLGIDMGEAELRGKSLSEILTILQSKFGGAARADMQTYRGSVLGLQLAWSDFQEEVGKAITQSPVVREALTGLTEIVRKMTAEFGSETGQEAIKTVTLLLADFAQIGILAARVANALGTGVAALWKDVTDPSDPRLFGHFRDFVAEQPGTDRALQQLALRLEELRGKLAAASTTPLEVDIESTRGVQDELEGLGGGAPEKLRIGFGLDEIVAAQEEAGKLVSAYEQVNEMFSSGSITAEQYGASIDLIGEKMAALADLGVSVSIPFEAVDTENMEQRFALEEELQDRLLALRIASAQQAFAEEDALFSSSIEAKYQKLLALSLAQEQLELEAINRQYERELAAASAIGADTTALYAAWEAERNLRAAQFSQGRIQIEQAEKAAKMALQSQMLGAISGFITAAFGNSKKAAIAQAIINTYEGASKAIAQGGIYGAILAAIVIATGMAQVAKIRSTNIGSGGGGGGGGAGGGGVANIPTQAAPAPTYTGSAGYLPTGPSFGTPQEPGTGTAAVRATLPTPSGDQPGPTFNITVKAIDSEDVGRWVSNRRNSAAIAERVYGEFIGR